MLWLVTMMMMIWSGVVEAEGDPMWCGSIGDATIIKGVGYAPGDYPALALAGGSGSGAVADVRVDSSGEIVDLRLLAYGTGYKRGDLLDAAVPGGAGFALIVDSTIDRLPGGGKRRESDNGTCLEGLK